MNRERKHRDAVRDDDTDGSAIRDDDAPATLAGESSHTAPAVRRGPGEVDLETAAWDVLNGATRVTGDRGDDPEHRLARRNRNQTEVVVEVTLATDNERVPLANRRCRVARRRGDLRAASHSPRLLGRPQSTLPSAIATPRERGLRTVCGRPRCTLQAWTRRITAIPLDMVANDWRVIGDLAMPT